MQRYVANMVHFFATAIQNNGLGDLKGLKQACQREVG
jgi:hypothetical protein